MTAFLDTLAVLGRIFAPLGAAGALGALIAGLL